MQKVIKEYEKTLTYDRIHFKIKLNGVGVHLGEYVLVDKLGILHGRVFNTVYHIGEDICSDGKVIITEAVTKEIRN